MTPTSYSKTFKVPMFLCDRFGDLPLSMLTRLMVTVSGSHTNSIDGGSITQYLNDNQTSWIILQYLMDVNRLPKVEEKITITTSANGYNRLFSYRKFEVESSDGELLAEGEMSFAWIDLNKRKMVRLNQDVMARFEAPYEKRIRRYPAPEPPNEEDVITENFQVHYSDIDMNGHVNNTVYIQWAIDSLGTDFLNNHQVSHLNIKYDKEVLEDQKVLMVSQLDDQGDNKTSHHQLQYEGKNNATVEIEWEER